MILAIMEENTPFHPPAEVHIRHLTGVDRQTGTFPPDLFAQIRQALAAGMDRLASQGMTAENVTRIVFTLSRTDGFNACFPLLNDLFARTCPATTLRLVSPFAQAGQLVEIDLVTLPGTDGDWKSDFPQPADEK
ncbi:endoribonuclease L-PSP [Gluconacetobacter sp. SXCC-1]|nr:endoribonuclease L-PSP [Gluconacetobacter sp. SXCC-1]